MSKTIEHLDKIEVFEKDNGALLIKNTPCSWVFVRHPDDNGKYRITFVVNEKAHKQIQDILYKRFVEQFDDKTKPGWALGSAKPLQDASETFAYSAKTSSVYTSSKTGEEVKNVIAIYKNDGELIPEDENLSYENESIFNVIVKPYSITYKGKKGIMLNLQALQEVDVSYYKGANDYASMFGIESKKTDDGYSTGVEHNMPWN